MKLRVVSALGLLLISGACPVFGGEGEDSRQSQNVDFVCGPRCVRFILQYYGYQSPSVTKLAEQLQLPIVEDGSSLGQIASMLSGRGVQVKAVRFDVGNPIKWIHPVILHLDGEAQEFGHFLVWLPSASESKVTVWDGLRGVRTEDPGKFSSRLSGVALLTAPSDESIEEILRSESRYTWTLAASSMLSVTAILYATRRSGRHGSGCRNNDGSPVE